jgi:two-component sensor histidine kinase
VELWQRWTSRLRSRLPYRIALTIGLFALALGARFVTLEQGYPFLTFFPAVIVITALAGWLPGLLAAIGGGIAAWTLFIPQEPATSTAGSALALFFYAATSAIYIALIEVLFRLSSRLADARAEALRLAEEQRLMVHEIQHRTANTMQFVSSLLTMQSRRIVDIQSARAAFTEATRRLDVLARVHRRLTIPAESPIAASTMLEGVCCDLVEAIAAERPIVLRTNVAIVSIKPSRLTPLALLATELISNAVKHAFPGERGGTIAVALQPQGQTHLMLEVRDDGCGPALDMSSTSRSLGMRVIHSLATQLDGKLTITEDQGTVARLVFPA